MSTLFEIFGKTEEELIADGWTINGLAIYKGKGSYAEGEGATADGEGAQARGYYAQAIGDRAVADYEIEED